MRSSLLVFVLFFAPTLIAQDAAPPAHPDPSALLLHPVSPMPSFSVASVVPSKPDDRNGWAGTNDDSYHARLTTIKEVLAYAFGVGYDQEMAKPPAWVSQDRFDIVGKLDDEQIAAYRAMNRYAREAQMRLMVQSLLQDRFHLVYHFESREVPLFRLQIAKGGFKCPRDTTSPPAVDDPSRPPFRMSASPPPPPPPPGWVPPSPAELKRLQQSMHMITKGWPFWLLVTSLSHQPEVDGKPVLDDTGLDGTYACDLQWSREGTEGPGPDFFPASTLR